MSVVKPLIEASWDQEPIFLTGGYIKALEALLRAEIEMMRYYNSEQADCWTWGIAYVGDLADQRGLSFEFGGDEDKPSDLRGDVEVRSKPRRGAR